MGIKIAELIRYIRSKVENIYVYKVLSLRLKVLWSLDAAAISDNVHDMFCLPKKAVHLSKYYTGGADHEATLKI